MATQFTLDFSGFEEYLHKLEKLGGDVKKTVDEIVKVEVEKISQDTHAAMAKSNLPAGGKYSKGTTEASIIDNAVVTWEGDTAWAPVGFDFSKEGAGGWLISGTPKMSPDKELNRIYRQKAYMAERQKEVEEMLLDEVSKLMA